MGLLCVIACGIAYPGVTANGLLALLTSVGVQTLVTLHTVGILLSQNILLPKQGLLAIVAVVALGHFDPGRLLREKQQDSESEKSRKARERTLLNESGFMQISQHATTFSGCAIFYHLNNNSFLSVLSVCRYRTI